MAKKSVVVLGAGFGGLRVAMDVAKSLRALKLLEKYEVILVDRNDCHLYTPLLYKLAAAPETQRETCTYDTSSLVKNLPVKFVQNEIAALDLPNGTIHLKNGDDIHADYLVIALGSETNYFGIAGMKENALQLKSAENAMQIRDAVTKAFAKGGNIRIAIGGGGPNGIELAAEIRTWGNIAEEENKNLHVKVSLVEAMPTVLTGFAPKVIGVAMKRLKKLGVTVNLGTKITAVSENEIGIDNASPIPFDVFIWTGGIKTPDMVTGMPVAKEPHGKPLATSAMVCAPGTPDLKLAPMIYGLGDSVCFMNPKTGRPVPAVARAAILEAGVAAHNVVEEIKKAETEKYTIKNSSYIPSDYPYVIPIGENWAVAKIGPIIFWGWPGAMFEKIVALHYLAGVMPLDDAFKAWKKM